MKVIGIHGKARSGKDELCSLLCDAFGFERLAFADPVKEIATKYFGLTHEQAWVKRNKASRTILQGIGNGVRNNLEVMARQHDKENGGLRTDAALGESGYPKYAEYIGRTEFGIDPKDYSKKRQKKYVKQVLEGVTNMWIDKLDEYLRIVGDGPTDLIWVKLLEQHCKPGIIYVVPDTRYGSEKKALVDGGNPVIKITRVDKPDIEAGADHPSEVELDKETAWFFEVINEHKTEWKELLLQHAINIVRKLDSQGYFSPEQKKKFKLNISIEV